MFAETSFDSLKVYQRLKSANMEEKAASEIAKIFGDMLDTQLATKRDIKELELATSRDIKELDVKIEQLRESTKRDIKELEVRLELKIENSKTELLKWVLVFLTGQTALLISAIKFLK